MQYLVNPTLPSESDLYKVIELMQSLVNTTLPSESDLNQVVEQMPSSINPTIPLESELSATQFFFISSSEISKQGGTDFALIEPSPSPWIYSFNQDILAELLLPSYAPCQIKFYIGYYTISCCIVYEGDHLTHQFPTIV